MILSIDKPVPNDCAHCPVFHYAALSKCLALNKDMQWYDANQGRDPDCPIVTVETATEEQKQLLIDCGFEI